MGLKAEEQRLEHINWWPAVFGFVALALAYALVSERLRLGPVWLLPVLALVALGGAAVFRRRGMWRVSRGLSLALLTASTLVITGSAAFLVQGLLDHNTDAGTLLQGGFLLWLSNMLDFALWYWEIDGGGPAHRHKTRCGSTDFAFPQKVLGGDDEAHWVPAFLDYLFLAFNTSTAFSPTDTMVLAGRAKVMMMYQSCISLVTVVVLVARAINAL